MNKPFTIYGAKGSGSIPVEAAMTLLDIPYEVVEAPTWEGDAQRDKVAPVNPMRQVPALVMPGGEVMTESAAMLIWLADQHPRAQLAPRPGTRERAAFLRWMLFIPGQIYPMFWIRDDLSRLAADKAHEAVLDERTVEQLVECWRVMEAEMPTGTWALGEVFSVLDLYIAVVSRWAPRRKRIYDIAPKLGAIARRVDADPRLTDFWAKRMPFEGAWEG